MTKLSYRPEIDGLRAIAVTAVVVFHIEKTALSNGFLGVDLFFVLSGYLITTIIWREARDQRFSIGAFYERRIRRIMPAMLMMLAVTTVASAAMLLPIDLVGYGKSVLATLAFVANIYFWRDTDYFSRLAEEKPLLHMWSLGVEEQFYILFPLLLVLLARWRSDKAAWIVGALTVGSLGLDYLASVVGASLPAFYLLPTRAWELGAGAVISLAPQVRLSDRWRTILAWIGIGLILFGLIGITAPLRGLYYMVAVVTGTCLALLAGQAGPGRFLAHPLPVWVGKISFSLYLWHWPIVVLCRYILVRDLGLGEEVALFFVMILAGWLSWRYVETPFRSSETMPRGRLLRIVGPATVAVAVMAVALIALKGLPARLPAKAARANAVVGTIYRCPVFDTILAGRSRGCILELPSGKAADADIALIGNSHAEMYAPLIKSYAHARGMTSVLIMATGCLPTRVINVNANCNAIADRYIEDVLALKRTKLVVLALRWTPDSPELVDGLGRPVLAGKQDAIARGIDDTIDRLLAAGKRVVLVGPIALPGWDVASISSRSLAFDRSITFPLATTEAAFLREYGPTIEHFSRRRDIVFVPVHEVQCREGGKEGGCRFMLDDVPLFADDNHLSETALPHYQALFEARLDAARAEPGNAVGQYGKSPIPSH